VLISKCFVNRDTSGKIGMRPLELRLALIANRFQKNDGQGRVNYEVALALLRRGCPVTLLTAYCADEIASFPNATLVIVGNEFLPTQLLKNLAFANDSARWLRAHRGDFDLVQANGFTTWEPCDIVTAHFVHTAWSKSPFFPHRDSLKPGDLYQRLFTALNARWERAAFGRAGHVIAVSEIVAADVAALGVPRDKVEVIYNGVDTDEFYPGSGERESFHLLPDVPLGLFVGDIRSPRKNLGTLLEAMQSLPGFHLAVAGNVERSPAPALALRLGIADRVHFLGKTARIPALMRSVDVFVFPSRYEAHPLVILEAMASGLPIVVSRNVGSVKSFGDLMEVVNDPDDVAALAKAIENVLNSPERRKRMGIACRASALTMKWTATAERYMSCYARLAGRGEVDG
jgi:glycosyltransferase involved in cell wall biosynthesis